jgi:hypothetical protein
MYARNPDVCFDLTAAIGVCACKKFRQTPDAIFSLAADVVAMERTSG